MEKKLKDYLHLYLGCRVMVTFKNFKKSKYDEGNWPLTPCLLQDCSDDNTMIIKPLLRPLSSMTEDEENELYQFVFKKPFGKNGSIKVFQEGTKYERKILWSGVERLCICLDGDIWADSDLQAYKYNKHEVTRWLLSKYFDLFNLIESSLAIETPSPDKS